MLKWGVKNRATEIGTASKNEEIEWERMLFFLNSIGSISNSISFILGTFSDIIWEFIDTQ